MNVSRTRVLWAAVLVAAAHVIVTMFRHVLEVLAAA